MRGVVQSFLRDGKRYFVPPTAQCFEDFDGRANLISRYYENILTCWNPPDYMHQFRAGGHARMLRRHIARTYFAHIDLKDFFEHISDTKVYRALRRIGLPHQKAYSLAGESTVALKGRSALPRGFHQSQLLASVVFDQSLIGSVIKRGTFSSLVTSYCDDIIMSSDDGGLLIGEFSRLLETIERANFSINKEKTLGPNVFTIAFNIIISKNQLAFTDTKLCRFLETCQRYKNWSDARGINFEVLYEKLIGRYVASINVHQEAELRDALGLNPRGG